MSRRPRDPGSAVAQRLLRWLVSQDSTGSHPILVGFSGGNDSLALAIALKRIRPSLCRDVLLIHVDHALRPDSANGAREAARLAQRLEFQFTSIRLEEGLAERHPGAGLEEAARRERFAVFLRFSQQHGGAPILAAHHRDDQAETVLLHLLRGAGLGGVSGMREISRLTVPWWSCPPGGTSDLVVWRPLLFERRADLEAIVRISGLNAIDDPTNRGSDFRRNQIRHALLPAIEKVMPGGTEAIVRFARITADEDALLDKIAQTALVEIRCANDRLAASPLLELEPAIARRVLLAVLRETGVEYPTLDRIDAMLELARSGQGGVTLELGSGYTGTLIRGQIAIEGPAKDGEQASV